MDIEFREDSKLNLFGCIYELFKGRNFSSFAREIVSKYPQLTKEMVKEFILEENIHKKVNSYTLLIKIYEEYKERWDKIVEKVAPLKDKFRQADLKSIDFSKAENFFTIKLPEKVKVFLCSGNETKIGAGRAYKPNIIFIYLRNYENYSDKNFKDDFRVLIHEIVHLTQPKGYDINKIEDLTKCFAPRGILIGKEDIKDEDYVHLIKSVEEAISNNKNFLEFI